MSSHRRLSSAAAFATLKCSLKPDSASSRSSVPPSWLIEEKRLRQRIERDRARRAQRTAGTKINESAAAISGDHGGGEAFDEDDGDSGSDGSDDGSLASFDSDLLASMDFDELEARLAANEARERKALTPFSSASDLKQISTEAEAADIRRTEYASLAQSKMGKQSHLELNARVVKEEVTAASVQERLEAAMADEQATLSVIEQQMRNGECA